MTKIQLEDTKRLKYKSKGCATFSHLILQQVLLHPISTHINTNSKAHTNT